MSAKRTGVYLGLDVGGTGAKAGVVDGAGRLLGFGQAGYSPKVTPDGHAEVPIDVIYTAARECVQEAVRSAGSPVAAMAVASQGQTFVALDEADQPLYPAILWYDSRAAAQADAMRAAVERAGGPGPIPLITPIASAPKIMWLREHYPERMARARRFLLLPEYFVYRLTGEAVTDSNTAPSTGLCADGETEFLPAALAAAGIAAGQVARIQHSGAPVRALSAAAAEWGLPADTLMVTGTNDQYAGALGAGNCRPGIVSVTTGTCLALVTLTERLPDVMPPGLYGGRFPIRRYRFGLAFSKIAGLLLDWFRREFAPDMTLKQLDEAAAGVAPGCGGLTVLPHFDGEISPDPNPRARGAFVGLSLQHGRAELYRATLESLAFSLRENLERLSANGFRPDTVRAIGGGAKSDVWLQMQADVTGLPVERPAVTEAAVVGAAMLAAAGAGAFPSLEDASAGLYRASRVFQPDPRAHAAFAAPYARYNELKRRIWG